MTPIRAAAIPRLGLFGGRHEVELRWSNCEPEPLKDEKIVTPCEVIKENLYVKKVGKIAGKKSPAPARRIMVFPRDRQTFCR